MFEITSFQRKSELGWSTTRCNCVKNWKNFGGFKTFAMNIIMMRCILYLFPINYGNVSLPTAPRKLHVPVENAIKIFGTETMTTCFIFLSDREVTNVATERVDRASIINFESFEIGCLASCENVNYVAKKTITLHGFTPPLVIPSTLP